MASPPPCPSTRWRRRLAVLFASVLLAGQGVSCAKNPVTGQPQLSLISPSQEVELGSQAAEQVIAAVGLVDDEAMQAYVQRVGIRIARDAERPDLPWTFRVLDDPTPNAFAMPGGYIFLTRGMMSLFNSEAELASVLGHEIAHVTARHSVEQLSRQQVAQLGLGLGSVLLPEIGSLSGLLGTGLQLMFLQHSRENEREADRLGFGYALGQGHDVREMPGIFAALDRYQARAGGSALPEWASTHPSTGTRIEDAEGLIGRLRGPVETLEVGREAYLAQIEGLVYGLDPRQGFFENGMFYYPNLALQMRFPVGWEVSRLPHVVVARAPGGDAVLQLGPAQGSPDAAARQFLAQSGVQPGPLRQGSLNGMPAAYADFQANTEQGAVQGTAAFVRHDGATYAMIGFAPASRIQRHQETISRSFESFQALRDPAILAVTPSVIEIVRLDQQMSGAQFAQRYPSVVGMEEVFLINQIQRTTSLPAGTWMKRVVRGPRVTAER